MNTFQNIILIGLGGNAAIGLLVLLSTYKRRLNQYFFLTTCLIAFWLLCMFIFTLQSSSDTLIYWVRQADAAAVFLPLGFFILRHVIFHPALTVVGLCNKIRYQLLAAFLVALLCQMPFFLRKAFFLSPNDAIPVVEYGPGFILYILYFAAMGLGMVVSVRKTFRASSGVQRTESQFLLLGWLFSFLFGLFLFTAAILLGTQAATRFLPLFALIMDGFVAYGIATRRILTVSAVLQRVVSYSLMAVYLTGVYILSVWLGRTLFAWIVPDPAYAAHLLAALVLAFSVAPAHGWMQAVSHRLFASANLLNVNVVLERAGQMFQEVSAEANLVEKFSELIEESFGTTRVTLLRPENNGAYRQSHPVDFNGKLILFQPDDSIIQLLNQDHEPFTVDTLHRMRPTSLVTGALAELEAMEAAMVIGSFMRKEMKAILLLSPKKSGRIYDLRDQRALQLLCDQFAVALENSNLYTTVQNGKIYNEILLDSLTSGIIAVNSNRIVTVFNQRAQKLTGLSEAAAVNQPMTVLPPALIEGLETILNTQAGFRDRDQFILLGGEEIPIRVSGSMFLGHTGTMLGALLVFNDMTVLKKMEEQIRRTDRLSSIGTLSAGMAHEIKNPLVTIKTFTQLLPQQYNDTDFRQTFFDLVGQEVNRIDTIVNRLLNFARPVKAALKPVSLHEIIENSLRLTEQQLGQNKIALVRHLDAKRHIIEADAEQMNQPFINFFLNAIHAMNKGGTLTVRTSVIKHSPDLPLVTGVQNGDCIQVDIQDTGCGIAPEDLGKIFDPFFTTKEHGVGLGLSVSHGIIQEHNGTIDVESEKGKGTVFHVQIPLLTPQEKIEE